MTARATCFALAAMALTIGEARAADVPEPEGYRLENYRAPTPATLRGAKTIGTQEAEKIWRRRQRILCRCAAATAAAAKACRRERCGATSRAPIFPAASGCPIPAMASLRPQWPIISPKGLAKVTHGDRTRLIVLYCLADCWMSWNAAKRALAIGYSNVAWYREGTDGWLAAGLPLKEATPEPRPDE